MRPLKIDTHLHTRYSGSSSLAIETLVQNARDTRQRVVVCTDHADDHAYDRLRRDLPRTLVIPAIEVEAEESDLLVYSADRDYIHSLCDFHGSIKELRRDEKTAIVWAHPCVSQRADLSHLRFAEQGPLRVVAGRVHRPHRAARGRHRGL
ncbi:MAG: hypothetical protein M5R36_01625 [Deltaproteobacteria bacterium]|nr:hypothetical protein [Deltaproteobacteria bacterium]